MDGWKVQLHIIPAGAEFAMVHWVDGPYTALPPTVNWWGESLSIGPETFCIWLFRDGGRVEIRITAEGAISFIINPLPPSRARNWNYSKKHRAKIDCLWWIIHCIHHLESLVISTVCNPSKCFFQYICEVSSDDWTDGKWKRCACPYPWPVPFLSTRNPKVNQPD